MAIEFKLEQEANPKTGSAQTALVKYADQEGGKDRSREVWCTVDDINYLFDTCARRWGTNWDLDKVCTAVRDTEIE